MGKSDIVTVLTSFFKMAKKISFHVGLHIIHITNQNAVANEKNCNFSKVYILCTVDVFNPKITKSSEKVAKLTMTISHISL